MTEDTIMSRQMVRRELFQAAERDLRQNMALLPRSQRRRLARSIVKAAIRSKG